MNSTFTLPNGVSRPLADVTFDAASQRAFYVTFDVTPYLTRAQLQAVAGDAFDVEAANRRASDAARIAQGLQPYADPQQMTAWDILTATGRGIGNDVASAAESIRSVVGVGVENAGKFKLYLTLGLLGLLAFALWRAGVFAALTKKKA